MVKKFEIGFCPSQILGHLQHTLQIIINRFIIETAEIFGRFSTTIFPYSFYEK